MPLPRWTVAVASGGADKATIAVLEKIHDRLGRQPQTRSTPPSIRASAGLPSLRNGPVEVASAVSEPRAPAACRARWRAGPG